LGLPGLRLYSTAVLAQQGTPPLLVVTSLDGLRPDCVTEADASPAKVPNLRRFMKEGAYADGVTGGVRTVTYPSHTTLVTRVWSAKPGIWANTTFDRLQKNYQGSTTLNTRPDRSARRPF
jgi:predicted AlkP superfamily pyrophosphatase or phosphodiesterase